MRCQSVGQGLVRDTCVYIDQMQDRSPQILDSLIAQRQVNHSTVAIQELMHTVGVLDPSDARTAGVIAEIGEQIKAMPTHRIFAPDVEVLGRGALLSGILCRLQGYERDGRLRALQNCEPFLKRRSSAWSCLRPTSATTISSFSSSPPDGRSSIVRSGLSPGRRQNGPRPPPTFPLRTSSRTCFGGPPARVAMIRRRPPSR